MGIITKQRFLPILNNHGENVILRKENTLNSPSLFDAIYGQSISTGSEEHNIKVVFQEISGTENWIDTVGNLKRGDAIIFANDIYSEDGINFISIEINDYIITRNRKWKVTNIIDERDAGNTVFLEIHLSLII